mmetsp:Transcript_30999/g.93096  ORF Transcript_30999/g.93096 Transcript_30999/m.93096 type:complete len:211 (-) Transcript_30999:2420-3052(-)
MGVAGRRRIDAEIVVLVSSSLLFTQPPRWRCSNPPRTLFGPAGRRARLPTRWMTAHGRLPVRRRGHLVRPRTADLGPVGATLAGCRHSGVASLAATPGRLRGRGANFSCGRFQARAFPNVNGRRCPSNRGRAVLQPLAASLGLRNEFGFVIVGRGHLRAATSSATVLHRAVLRGLAWSPWRLCRRGLPLWGLRSTVAVRGSRRVDGVRRR